MIPVTPHGNKYVVCCIDAFTKWPEAATIPNKEASTVADFFLSDIISRHGTPQTVVSDNGREFDGESLKLLEDCYIEHRHSSPNHPQTNGFVERFNQTLRQALQKSVKDHKDWARQQRDFQQRHIARTRKSPEDDFEREALLHDKRHKTQHATHASEDCTYEIIKPPTTPSDKREDFSRAAFGPSALTSATVHRPLKVDSIRDLNTQLQYGDFVMIKNPHKRNKLDKDLIGPYKFISFTDETCTVALLLTNSGKGWKESTYNISPLKKPWENTPPPLKGLSRDL